MKRSNKNSGVNGRNGRGARAARKESKSNGRAETPSRFYGLPLPGVKLEDLGGSLIVLEGSDGSGRSTQISLLTEWLESQGFAVQTMGLRRSFLVGENIDALLEENAVTRASSALRRFPRAARRYFRPPGTIAAGPSSARRILAIRATPSAARFASSGPTRRSLRARSATRPDPRASRPEAAIHRIAKASPRGRSISILSAPRAHLGRFVR